MEGSTIKRAMAYSGVGLFPIVTSICGLIARSYPASEPSWDNAMQPNAIDCRVLVRERTAKN